MTVGWEREFGARLVSLILKTYLLPMHMRYPWV